MSLNGQLKPEPKYRLGRRIKVPKEVHESLSGEVVGVEWGPDSRSRSNGWLYYIQLPGIDGAWKATEEELNEWQRVCV